MNERRKVTLMLKVVEEIVPIVHVRIGDLRHVPDHAWSLAIGLQGIVYDCKWHRASDCCIHATTIFSCLLWAATYRGGEWRRGLQEVTWGYPSKTHWASFVPVLRQPNICQLFVNFSFETFLANLFEPPASLLVPPTYTSEVLWLN